MSPFGGRPIRGDEFSEERWQAIAQFFKDGGDATLELVHSYRSPNMVVLVAIERAHVLPTCRQAGHADGPQRNQLEKLVPDQLLGGSFLRGLTRDERIEISDSNVYSGLKQECAGLTAVMGLVVKEVL
jgi:hypothetical protein